MLKDYERKRHLGITPEPPASVERPGEGPLIFVVQKHAARQLHYDFRLEVDGVLKSWAVPHGPSLDPKSKRLAVMVEDHPLDYASFEGMIPKWEYGAGQVIVWDQGSYSPDEGGQLLFHDRDRAQEEMRRGLDKGKISITLRGRKLKGSWTLVRMHPGSESRMRGSDKNWLLIKHQDGFADPGRDILKEGRSVLSGVTIEDIKTGHLPVPADPPLSRGSLPGARQAPMPDALSPMLASLAARPFSHPDWLFEPKLDGYRTIALLREGSVRLLSRNGLDNTAKYPFVVASLRSQPVGQAVLDGEIVALDDQGRPCFQCLQQHLKLERGKRPAPPIVYYVFDLLYLDGFDLRDAPLRQRKELLSAILQPSDNVRLVGHFEKDGVSVYEAALKQGLEGILAKRQDSVYESGRRSPSWLKVKATRSDEFVIGGYSQGIGARAHTFGALLVGYYDGAGRLIYAGHVGTGFDEDTLHDLLTRLEAMKTDERPFAQTPPTKGPTVWVRPELVAEVKFTEWTQEGYLRNPVFLRLREDKPAAEVRRTQAAAPPAPAQPVRGGVVAALTPAENVLRQLRSASQGASIEVEGHRLLLTNLSKELWPAVENRRPLTKRDLLTYLTTVSPYLLPHLKDRPITLTRYPDGIHGERFYQKHWEHPLPEFVNTIDLFSEENNRFRKFLLCNNLPTLVWLGQLADLELHTWFSRVALGLDEPDLSDFTGPDDKLGDFLANYPDFIVFDLDPYLFAGTEARGEEPELNRRAFARTGEVALWLKELLDGLSLSSFVKTSGKTGLHVFAPIVRQFDFHVVRRAAETIGRYLLQRHPQDITMEWTVEKRTGKVFFDHNQNVRGRTLASLYSPRPTPLATVSMPLRWDELGRTYPTDFTILNAPRRLAATGDLWAGILNARGDLSSLLKL
ncbi:MAG: DNA ligase D [Chloroflexi bacterium]|nr:DNA ligase D [Chloroflexota bacterium]